MAVYTVELTRHPILLPKISVAVKIEWLELFTGVKLMLQRLLAVIVFLSTPKIVDCINDYNNLSVPETQTVSDSMLSVWLPCSAAAFPRCLHLGGHKVSGDWQFPVAQLPDQEWVRAGVSVLPGAVLPPWKWGSVIAFSPSSALLFFPLTGIFVFSPQHFFPTAFLMAIHRLQTVSLIVSQYCVLSFTFFFTILVLDSWVLLTTDLSSRDGMIET